MAVVSYDTYVRLTGDDTTPPAEVEAFIADAVSMVEDALDRDLESMERTETVRVGRGGWAAVRATPITAVPAGSAYRIGTTALLVGVYAENDITVEWPWRPTIGEYPAQRPEVEVTYTGGWTEATLPFNLKRAISLLAYAMKHAPTWQPPAGASRTVGDVSLVVGVNAASAGQMIDSLVPGLWRTIRGRQRRVL